MFYFFPLKKINSAKILNFQLRLRITTKNFSTPRPITFVSLPSESDKTYAYAVPADIRIYQLHFERGGQLRDDDRPATCAP